MRARLLNYNKQATIIILFFLTLIYVFGRDINYNAELEESGLNNILKRDSLVAPFLIIGTTLLYVLIDRKKNFTLKYIHNINYWKFFIGFQFIALLFRGNFEKDIRIFGVTLLSYLMCFYIINYAYKIPFKKLELLFTYLSTGIVLISVTFHFLQGHHLVYFPNRSEYNFERLGGLFYYAHTSALISITTLFSINIYLNTRNKAYLLLILLLSILLIATDTRSAWFTTIFSLLFIYYKKAKFSNLLILCVSVYFLLNILLLYYSSHENRNQEDSNFRTEIWLFSLKLLYKNIIFGYGDINPFLSKQFLLNDRVKDPHNSLISLALQNGVISCFIYLLIYVRNCIYSENIIKSQYRFLLFFWLFFPFFWGNIYNSLGSFISMYMMFTIYVFALNPNSTTIK